MVLFGDLTCCYVPKDGYDTDRSDAEDSVMETTPTSGALGKPSPRSDDVSERTWTEEEGGYEVWRA